MRYGLPIIPTSSLLGRAQLAMRMHLCSDCPSRSSEEGVSGIDTARACETGCEFFQQLPRLIRIARHIDPLVGSFEGMMNARIREICESLPRSAHHRRNYILTQRPQIIRALARIFEHRELMASAAHTRSKS